MAKLARKYAPGYTGHVELDEERVAMQGWTSDDSVDELDMTTDEDNGWSLTEGGVRTTTFKYTIPIKAGATTSPIVPGDIYPHAFLIGSVAKFNGPCICTSATVNSKVKEGATLDVTVKNYGDVSIETNPYTAP
ncbi:hypothetical protein TA3x_004277 [Tundrisphaera sp. TA3]|uniref:hypothetical protein n=1 Tax=Tundrisphaera sp. TA3 TaxID=3435775 RepID=UPI003EBFBADB